jgi:hypothetical protein
VVQLIQSKVVSVAEAELLKSKAAQARAKSSSHSATTIDSALMSRPTPDQVDEQWARAFVRKGLPLDLVDDKEFRKAVTMTARAGLPYVDAAKCDTKLPHRTKMTTSCIPELDQKLEAKVRKRVDALLSQTGDSACRQ